MSRPTPKRLAIGVVGIGRIGRQHALNALHHIPTTNLLCVCSPAQADLDWAQEHLVPWGVHVYKTFDELIAEPGLEAVIIASTTKLHKEHVLGAIQKGLHVLCEKPLSMSAAETRRIVEEVRKSENRRLKVMTAYSRRFDQSYMNVVKAIEQGKIGAPVVVRSETRDKFDKSEFYMRYVMANPGIFIDTLIHDVDLTLAFLGADARPKSAQAIGTVSLHPELKTIQDVDNGMGIVEWYPSERTKGISPVAYYFASRIMKHGFDNPTEVIGTEGALKVNLHPRRDLITIADSNGVGNDVMPDFYERYEKAFVTEVEVFADAVLNDKPLPYEVETAQKGMEIVEALQESLRTGRKIEWDENGNRKDTSSKL